MHSSQKWISLLIFDRQMRKGTKLSDRVLSLKNVSKEFQDAILSGHLKIRNTSGFCKCKDPNRWNKN